MRVLIVLTLCLLLLEPLGVRGQATSPGPSPLGALYTAAPLVRSHLVLRGLVGWWRVTRGLEEGPRVYNLSDGGTAAVLNNMAPPLGWRPTSRPGGEGHWQFDGNTTGLSVATYPRLNNLQQFTFVACLNPVSFGGSDRGYVLDKTMGGGGLVWSGYNTAPATNGMRLIVDFATSSGSWYADNMLTLGTWQCVAVSYNRQAATTPPTFYRNGLAGTTTELATPSGAAVDDSVSDVGLGHIGTVTDHTRTIDGSLDEVMVFNRILNATELRGLLDLSRKGWPGVLRRQSDLVGLTGPVIAAATPRRGSFFPFIQKERP